MTLNSSFSLNRRALGGLLAATDRRYRLARQEQREAAAAAALAGAKA